MNRDGVGGSDFRLFFEGDRSQGRYAATTSDFIIPSNLSVRG